MQIRALSYTFPHQKTPFFQDVNFDLRPHAVNFLIGKNGGGKTTLADILMGLRPAQGTLTPKLSAIYLNQQLPLLSGARVEDVADLVLGIEYGRAHLSLTALKTRVDAPTLAFLTPLWTQHYGDLSGGQRKLVQLLLFLQVDRELIILDEPTAFLDREHAALLFTVMQTHPERTYLMITHDVRDLAAFADYQVLWLADRQIKASLTRQQFEQQAPDSAFLKAFSTV